MVATFRVIAAMDRERGIGRDGRLPWNLPREMSHFARTTTEVRQEGHRNAIFMGRVNWQIESEIRPLPDRLNIVLTRDGELDVPDGVLVCSSIDETLERLGTPPLSDEIESIFCIGGSHLYEQALAHPRCEALILTRIDASYDCDAFFPPFEDRYALASVLSTGVDGDVTWRVESWRPI